MAIQQMLLGAGGGPPGPDIDEVFHINTYSGNQSNRSFNTGLDFATNGGAIWNSVRNQQLKDMAINKSTGNTDTYPIALTGNPEANSSWFKTWDSTGYSIGTNTADNTDGFWNKNGHTYVNWGWRNCDKFFKEIKYTGNGTDAGQAITHGLGSTPGFIIVRGIESSQTQALCYHRSMAQTHFIELGPNTNKRAFNYHAGPSRSWSVNSTTFNVPNGGGGAYTLNVNNKDYVAWIFADHSSEGSFGSSGNKKAIICDKYTGNGSSSGPTITLGFQPQWLLVTSFQGPDPTSGQWWVFDDERGFDKTMTLQNHTENDQGSNFVSTSSTGFTLTTSNGHINENNTEYLYIAIAAST
tara:strand:- start:89 stop:1147 length:1059 start_codon:yes stop_codon:yes gene_type:complete